jgi:hypothetical protein
MQVSMEIDTYTWVFLRKCSYTSKRVPNVVRTIEHAFSSLYTIVLSHWAIIPIMGALILSY